MKNHLGGLRHFEDGSNAEVFVLPTPKLASDQLTHPIPNAMAVIARDTERVNIENIIFVQHADSPAWLSKYLFN